MIQLRPYQQTAIDNVRSMFRRGVKRVLLTMPTGSGKTVCFSYMASVVAERSKSITLVAHRDELIDQISRTLYDFGVGHSFIAANRPCDPKYTVQVASVQTLVRRLDRYREPDLLIVDECFPCGTLVDGKNIEDVRRGDKVKTHIGYGVVKDVFVKKVDEIIRIKFSSGRTVCVTGGHPFATPSAWVPAGALTSGSMVLTITDHERLYNLRGTGKEEALRSEEVPLGIFSPHNNEFIQEAWRGNNEVQKNERHEQTGNKGQGFDETTRHEVGSDSSRRKWERTNDSRDGNSGGSWMGLQSNSEDRRTKEWTLPKSLQNRCWERIATGSDRGGRILTFCYVAKDAGQKERRIFGVDRVESVEVHEQANSREFEKLCPGGVVYNLHVDNGNTYFANDFLVHNCHHAVSTTTWGRIINHYKNSYVLGVTATPCRLSGEGLGDLFQEMIIGPTVQELIALGALCDYRPFVPSTFDASGMRQRGGDYVREEAAAKMDKPTITGDAVKHYRKLSHQKPAVAFCVRVDHAEHVAGQFKEAGYSAASVDGSMDKDARRRIIRDFSNGQVNVLTSCDLISEGFDVPGIETAILLRPTASLSLYLQQVGRALRPSRGKEYATILDHCGNIAQHGLPDDDREWTLESTKRGAKEKSEDQVNVKVCKFCFAAMRSTQMTCKVCGNAVQPKVREVEQRDGELVEVDKEQLRKEARRRQGQAKTLEELVALGKEKGYKNPYGWAKHILAARGG